MAEVTLPLVIGAALIDGINPCAFGVLIFMLAFLMQRSKSRASITAEGLVYIAGVFVTYLVAGLLLLPVIRQLGKASVVAYYVFSGIVIFAGLLEIKDFFWYGKGLNLAILPSAAQRIKLYIGKVSENKMSVFALGSFVALVELPCTGAVYLAVLTLMTIAGVEMSHIFFLILYNLIFILPLVVILVLFQKGVNTSKFEQWRTKHKALMRLITGLVLVGLGIWMFLAV